MAKSRGSRGLGSTYKYKGTSGKTLYRWQAVVPVEPEDPNGPRKRVTKGGYLSKKDAQLALQAALQRVRVEAPALGSKRTFESYASQWLSELDLAGSTKAGYLKIVRTHLNPSLGKMALSAIRSQDIKSLYAKLRVTGRRDSKAPGEALSESTVSKIHLVLAAILESAKDEGLLFANPAKHKSIKAPGQSRRTRALDEIEQVLSKEQLTNLLTWIDEELGDDLYPLWHLIANTGLRRSEAIALTWADLNFSTRILSVRRAADTSLSKKTKATKTYKARAVALDAKTIEVIRAFKTLRATISNEFTKQDAFMFATINNELRGPNDVTARWSRLVAKARERFQDLPNITLKGLRHTHATLLLQAGVNPKIVQERLGHSNIGTTLDIYSHVTPTIQAEAIDNFSSWMQSKLTHASEGGVRQ
jgi:integrase